MPSGTMSPWEANSTILRAQYSGLLEAITQEDDCATEGLHDNFKIETAASGLPTLTIEGRYVHSPRDPEREGRRLAAPAAADSASTADSAAAAADEAPALTVILGFGLGYAAQAAAEHGEQPIIIVEKNRRLLRTAFETRDLTRLLSRPAVAFIPGGDGEGISGALSFFEQKNGRRHIPRIIRNRTLTALDERWYAAVENRIRAWAMRDDVNQATLAKFGKRWVRNLSRNMSAIRDLPGITPLAGLASDAALPVFLAAAGPSLERILPLLPQIRPRCIIVAVDTSLRFLLRHGIEPDFVLVVDPQFWNSRHLNCLRQKPGVRSLRLIVESAVYPPVLRLPVQGLYLCGSLYPPGMFIEQRVDPKGALGAGGSVATAAWDFARTLGTREIWIAGLDLAFPGLKTHFKGAQFEEKALVESGRLHPAETWLVHALRDGIPFNAPALGGGQVRTDRRLSLYAAWFEQRFRLFPAIRNYSLSGGDGLNIPGLEPATAEAFLALPNRRAEIDHLLETAHSRIKAAFFEPETARQRGERYENAVAALYSGLRHIQAACARGITSAEKALKRHSRPAERTKILAELDAVNRLITDSAVKDIAGFLFPPQTLAAINAAPQPHNEDAAFRGYLESSLRLYRSLAQAAREMQNNQEVLCGNE